MITGTNERLHAAVLANDARSGLGVLRPEVVLPAPPSVGELPPTSTAVALSLGGTSGAPISWERITISSTDVPIVIDHVALGAVRAATHLDQTAGSVLVSSSGTLEAVSTPRLGAHLYLPASLIIDLALRLAQGTPPSHCALRISAQTSSGAGARVIAVDPTGPSAGVLFEGDVVIAIEGSKVHTASELVDALYVQDAAVALHLTVRRHGNELQVLVAPVPTS